MEMMHHEAGVRVVVAGGQPVNGPMQYARYATTPRTLLNAKC